MAARELVTKRPVTVAPPIVHEVLRSPGRPLEAETRDWLEPRLGHNFGDVRVHADRRAAASARAVGAQAYTVGRHVVFGDGRYAPGTEIGRRTLVHELIHTIQQGDAPTEAPLPVLAPDHPAERLDGGGLPAVTTRAPAAVARQEDPENPLGGPARPAVTGPDADVTELGSGSGDTGGKPGPGIPDCTAVMGGRQVEHWLAGDVLGANHTYINFKQDKDNYWLVEAGPLPTDNKKVGAWAKKGSWEGRGNRIMTTYKNEESCTRARTALFDAQSTYHSLGLPYDPNNGPNSNSFTEHMTTKAPVFGIFHRPWDWRFDYWQSHPRPF